MVATLETILRVKGQSARQRLVALVRREMQDDLARKGETSVTEVIPRVTSVVLSDREFVSELVKEAIANLCRQVYHALVSESRGGADPVYPSGDSLVTDEGLRKRAERFRNRWWDYLEHVGDRYVPFGEMTKADLLEASRERQERADRDGTMAALERHVGYRLKEGEKVKDRFTDTQLDALMNRFKKDRSFPKEGE